MPMQLRVTFETLEQASFTRRPRQFLTLPRELRDEIYLLALVEPAKWDRQHRPLCQYFPKRHDETTACALVPDDYRQKGGCDCFRRAPLTLLLANRHVYEEAAPLFWSRNTFCWSDVPNFYREVGSILRPGYRRLIRHISLLDIRELHESRDSRVYMCEDMGQWELLWGALGQCTALRTLEISPGRVAEYLEKRSPALGQQAAPGLETLEKLVHLERVVWCNTKRYHLGRVDPFYGNKRLRRSVLVQTRQPAILEHLVDSTTTLHDLRQLQTIFQIHCEFAIETQLLGRQENLFRMPFQSSEPGFVLQPQMIGKRRFFLVRLRDGTLTRIKFHGLPLGAEEFNRQTKIRKKLERQVRVEAARISQEGVPGSNGREKDRQRPQEQRRSAQEPQATVPSINREPRKPTDEQIRAKRRNEVYRMKESRKRERKRVQS
ncbi:hypothetical protein GQ53DRAFT_466187 [Thozetella sp. PMI_491]|nr:hypothetical protein GQ53DRAFT_466187 [Thozetella sp. PMI_491]